MALCRVIDRKFGEFAPGLADLKKSLDEVRTFVETIVKEKRILEPDPVQDMTDGEAAAASAPDESAIGWPASGPLQSRQEALKRLAEVAEFFRRTEPHSPVSYLVQRAIRWGRMPLESWLEDVIKNDGVLDHLRETLGLNRGSDGSEGNGS